MDKKDLIKERANLMDWPEAVALLKVATDHYASRIASEGKFSQEAVAKSCEYQAAWIRIQR